jgi:hypothetical protein
VINVVNGVCEHVRYVVGCSVENYVGCNQASFGDLKINFPPTRTPPVNVKRDDL